MKPGRERSSATTGCESMYASTLRSSSEAGSYMVSVSASVGGFQMPLAVGTAGAAAMANPKAVRAMAKPAAERALRNIEGGGIVVEGNAIGGTLSDTEEASRRRTAGSAGGGSPLAYIRARLGREPAVRNRGRARAARAVGMAVGIMSPQRTTMRANRLASRRGLA